MKYKSSYLWILMMCISFLFHNNIFSSTKIDECDLLYQKLKDRVMYALDENVRFQMGYFEDNTNFPMWNNGANGIFYEIDFDQDYSISNYRPYKRDQNNNIILNLISPELLYENIEINASDLNKAIVIKINNINTSSLSDEEIKSLIPENKYQTISLEILSRSGDTIFIELGDEFRFQNEVLLELIVEQISNINSSQSTFDAQFIEKFYYYQLGLEEIGLEIYEQVYGLEDRDFEFRSQGFHCKFQIDEIRDLKIFYPNTFLSNAINEDIQYESITYWFSYFNESSMQSFWEKTSIKSATIKSDFSYESFPFDSQTISFNYEIINDMISYPYVARDTPIYKSLNNIKLDNWNVRSYSYSNYLNFSHESLSDDDVGLQINFMLERSYVYYLTKVYIPILIILLVTLSTLFVNPKELESRLTVSVVCFLALIAYTYVVDKDLPKLTYLTAMDKMILISYFFAAIPTLQSIYVHNVLSKNPESAIKINNMSKMYIPLIYVLLILLNIFLTILGSENTISALSFTT